MMGCDGFGLGSGFGIAGLVLGGGLMLLFWVALILLIVWLVRALTGPRRGPESAREVLDRRLASGEISAEEHARMRQSMQT